LSEFKIKLPNQTVHLTPRLNEDAKGIIREAITSSGLLELEANGADAG